MKLKGLLIMLLVLMCFSSTAMTGVELKPKLEKYFVKIESITSDESFLKLVMKYSIEAEKSQLNNSKWKSLAVRDPEVQKILKNELSILLKNEFGKLVSEAFINSKNGNKLAFISKPTSFNHKGKEKHEVPLKGTKWIGEPEVDQSTGEKQIQISAPIYINKNIIGTIVLGIKLVNIL